jgi:hypothetical protein
MALKKWFKRLGSSESGGSSATSRPPGPRPREGRNQPAAPPASQPEPSVYDDDDDEDYDQPIHDLEQAQDDYLMSVALATSASEYEYASKRQSDTEEAIKPPARTASTASRGEALAFKFWQTGRCAPRIAT